MLPSKLISVTAVEPSQLRLVYETGETKLFDVSPYIEGSWYGELRDPAYFRTVHLIDDGAGIEWEHGQDLAPHELYELSRTVSKGNCVLNGIAYAGDKTPPIKVSGVRPLEGYQLWLRFNTGEVKVFDFRPLLSAPAFLPLNDPAVFRGVYIDYGATVWNDGEIDIAPEYLYENALSLEQEAAG